MLEAGASETQELVEFDGAKPGEWVAVNDTVMGGRSDGDLEIKDGVLHFSGNLSLENNGGFSSIRHATDVDLGERRGIRLKVKGDGRSYQLRLNTDARYYQQPVAFSATFETREDDWVEVEIPFDQLTASFRGRQLSGYDFDPSNIRAIGVLLGDKTPGPFKLKIEEISAY